MPKLKVLSAKEVIAILESFGFECVAQKGSHMKFRRHGESGQKQTLTIPNHKTLDRGTLHAIYRQTVKYVAEDELFGHFYDK